MLIRRSEDPADTILKIANDYPFDLIVIGNRAETQAERFELGSITEKVAIYSKIPVLITKRKTKIGKLLVAVDGSEKANKAIQYASALATKFKAKVTLVNVEEIKLVTLQPEVVRKIGENILSDASAQITGVQVEKRLEAGSPAGEIIKLARKENFDLIILGNRGSSSVKRFLLGSVTEDVSMHAKRSVLIVR